MAIPTNYDIALYVDGVNIISHCPYEAMDLDDLVHDPSTFSFKVENASALTIEQNAEVLVFSMSTSPVRLIFSGYILALRQSKRDNGITVEYEVDCEDMKVRLQKSVIPYRDYFGLDGDILSDLLADTFPDLSSLFDFTSGVNSFADDLSLAVNDDNLLDMLKKLSEQAGAKWRLDRDAGGGEILITFDAGGWGEEITSAQLGAGRLGWLLEGSLLITDTVATGGNPDNCAKFTDHPTLNSISNGTIFAQVYTGLGGSYAITEISFDYRVSGSSNIRLYCGVGTPQTAAIAGTGAWHSHSFTISGSSSSPNIGFQATANINTSALDIDCRFDNIRITTTTPVPQGTIPPEELIWDSEANATDFDFDIQNGDEYGFDFNFDIGGFDDFNAIIVTGGNTEEAISWTYHSNPTYFEEHLGLELPVKEIAVFQNTNTDASPTWDALDVGEWGVDKLLFETDGTKEVLYDSQKHWLYFDTSITPANLEKAIKVEGFILRPIRVLVENAGDAPIYATTMYDESITSEDMAAQIGFNELEKRNASRQLTFKTHNPGLKVGQSISVVDSARPLDETLIIQRIHVTWMNNKATFEVECGNAEEANASILIANNDKRSREKAAPAAIGTTSFEALLDSDGSTLYDSDGTVLYESA